MTNEEIIAKLENGESIFYKEVLRFIRELQELNDSHSIRIKTLEKAAGITIQCGNEWEDGVRESFVRNWT